MPVNEPSIASCRRRSCSGLGRLLQAPRGCSHQMATSAHPSRTLLRLLCQSCCYLLLLPDLCCQNFLLHHLDCHQTLLPEVDYSAPGLLASGSSDSIHSVPRDCS